MSLAILISCQMDEESVYEMVSLLSSMQGAPRTHTAGVIPTFLGHPVREPYAREDLATGNKGGIVVGAFWRTWIRLSQRLKKNATPASSAPTAFSEPIKSLRLSHKLTIDSLRNHRLLAARSHLRDMDQYIAELESIDDRLQEIENR